MIVLLSTPLYYQSLTESGLTDLFVLSIITNHKCIRNFSIFTSRMCWCRVLEIICWRVDVSDIRTLEMQMLMLVWLELHVSLWSSSGAREGVNSRQQAARRRAASWDYFSRAFWELSPPHRYNNSASTSISVLKAGKCKKEL